MSGRLDAALDVLDAGLQSTTLDHLGCGDGSDPDECWRCGARPSSTDVGLCGACVDDLRAESPAAVYASPPPPFDDDLMATVSTQLAASDAARIVVDLDGHLVLGCPWCPYIVGCVTADTARSRAVAVVAVVGVAIAERMRGHVSAEHGRSWAEFVVVVRRLRPEEPVDG